MGHKTTKEGTEGEGGGYKQDLPSCHVSSLRFDAHQLLSFVGLSIFLRVFALAGNESDEMMHQSKQINDKMMGMSLLHTPVKEKHFRIIVDLYTSLQK